jgi:hypothetical protein
VRRPQPEELCDRRPVAVFGRVSVEDGVVDAGELDRAVEDDYVVATLEVDDDTTVARDVPPLA